MKKAIITISILLTFQLLNAQEVTFGVKAGGNYSKYIEDTFKYKFGYSIGVYSEFKLSDKIFLQPELLYSLQGTKLNVIVDFLDAEYAEATISESNIVLPVLGKYYVNDKLYVGLGPQLDFSFNKRYNSEVEVRGDKSSNETNFSFGVLGDVGYYFTERIGASFRYGYGFSKKLFNYKRFNNSVFSLNLEYRFVK